MNRKKSDFFFARFGKCSLTAALSALPDGCSTWVDYTENLNKQEGLALQPAFFAAHSTMKSVGSVILGVAALRGIFQ